MSITETSPLPTRRRLRLPFEKAEPKIETPARVTVKVKHLLIGGIALYIAGGTTWPAESRAAAQPSAAVATTPPTTALAASVNPKVQGR